jgi:hypothetical protein
MSMSHNALPNHSYDESVTPAFIVQMPHCQRSLAVRYHPTKMLSLLKSRMSGQKLEDLPAVLAATATEAIQNSIEGALPEIEESTVLRTIGWVSAGLGAVALGLFVGRELRQRYKFNRRTPYDFYAHSGDETQDMEFGVGI